MTVSPREAFWCCKMLLAYVLLEDVQLDKAVLAFLHVAPSACTALPALSYCLEIQCPSVMLGHLPSGCCSN